MPRWVDAARKLVARIAGQQQQASAGPAGTAWDGLGAVLRTEQRLGAVLDEGPARQALAAAAGRALAGQRATAWLDGTDLLAAHDRLTWCAGRGLPLVVHTTLGAADGHATAAGTGHEAWHGISGTGCFQLIAASAQEAVDLALAARIIAERALATGVVAMDREQTAMAMQRVDLPTRQTCGALAGDPADTIACPTDGQRALFGPERARLPAWFDLARPVMLGGTQGPEAYGLGVAARRPYQAEALASIIDDALRRVGEASGNPLAPLRLHRVEDAELVIVAQGSLVETAIALADHLRDSRKQRVGVVGVRLLRPWPAELLRVALSGAARVVVLERADAPLAMDTPLAAELRPLLRSHTRLHQVPCGLGGLPVRAADLALLLETLPQTDAARVYLGLDFAPSTAHHPRRQAMFDVLRRDRPDLVGRGLRAPTGQPLDLRPAGTTTVEIVRPAGATALARGVARVLASATSGGLRGRPADEWLDEAVPRVDRMSFGPAGLVDCGDEVPADIAILVPPMAEPGAGPIRRLVQGGTVLILAEGDDAAVLAALPPALRSHLARLGCAAYAIAPGHRPDLTAAAGLALLLRQRGDIDTSDRALRSALAEIDGDLAADLALQPPRALNLPPAEQLPPPPLPEPPLAVRHLDPGKGQLDDLAGFWGQVGVLYAQGATDELVPDPLLASGAVPPLSATLRDLTPTRTVFPSFDPSRCTGCARCWAACPDGSIGAVSLSPRGWLDAAMDRAAATGKNAGGLRSMAGKVAKELAKHAASGSAGAQLAAAVDAVLAKGGVPEDRLAAVEEGRQAVADSLADLPIIRTDAFFDDAPKGKEELLAVVFDADTCKACRSCWAVCPTDAIEPQPQSDDRMATVRAGWRLWEQLPDTAGATIARAAERDDVDHVGALLMSRHALLAMAGADAAEPGSGDRLCLRAALGVAEASLQPRLAGLVAEAGDLGGQLRAAVRGIVADAVPADDVAALAGALSGRSRHDVDVANLVAEAGGAKLGARDVERMAALLSLADELDDLAARLAHGSIGLGRARMGLVLGPSPAAWWGALFPYNPFQIPVVDDGGPESSALARGIAETQLAGAIADLDLLRRARVAVAGRGEAVAARRFSDLDADERAACPPLLLVGDDRLLGSGGLGGGGLGGGGLDSLLATGLPVRVVVLSDADLLGAVAPEPGLLATARARNAYVAQTSVGAPAHLARSLLEAFAHDGPAVIRMHAPSPRRHGFDTHGALVQATAAVRSRAWPLIRLDPSREGVFGSLIDLDGNPEPTELQAAFDGQRIGPTDWATTEGRYADVDPARLAAAADARLATWRVLQELAGVVTPFTAAVRAAAEADLAAAHDATLAALKAEHQAELAQLRAAVEAELAARIRDRLVTLSARGAATRGATVPASTQGTGD